MHDKYTAAVHEKTHRTVSRVGFSAAEAPGFSHHTGKARELLRLYVGSSRAFLASSFNVAYFLTVLQRLEAVYLDFGEMYEQVVAACIRSDKAKAFGVIEKFNGAGFHDISLT